MVIPSCILLWHGLAVVLEPIAAKEWKATTILAARHGVDINTPPLTVKVVPDEQNFLGHPYLKELIFRDSKAPPGLVKTLSETVKPHLPALAEAGDKLTATDLVGALEAIDQEHPDLLQKAGSASSPGRKILAVLDQCGIPWGELLPATARPSSQLPPLGSTAPEPLATPANSMIIPSALFHFLGLARARTYAAMEAGNHETALQSMRLQMRTVDGFLDGDNYVNLMLGTASSSMILHQIREGLQTHFWHPADLDLFAGWITRRDIENQIKNVLVSELFFGLREIEFVQKNPDISDQRLEAIANTPAAGLLGNSNPPFGQRWLLYFRERSGGLYRISPPAFFQFWRIDSVRNDTVKKLKALNQTGLLGLAFPDKPEPDDGSAIKLEAIFTNFLKHQTRINLFLTSRALSQYHAVHSDYPDELTSLPPDLAGDFTNDPFTSTPLKYERLTPTSYRLYSVGADFSDDGGKPITDEGGDICWHLP